MLHVAEELTADAQHHRPVPATSAAAKAASPARPPGPALYRSRSCRSGCPAAEPPSKSDSSCRTTDPDAIRAISDRSLFDGKIQPGAPRTRRELIPTQGTVVPMVFTPVSAKIVLNCHVINGLRRDRVVYGEPVPGARRAPYRGFSMRISPRSSVSPAPIPREILSCVWPSVSRVGPNLRDLGITRARPGSDPRGRSLRAAHAGRAR